jgi:arsenate reductase
MAEGILRQLAGERFDVESAGVAPSSVRTEAIEVMREIGIDASGQRSKPVDEFLKRRFDFVITVCDNANENCPVFSGEATRIHWNFDDPAAVEGSEIHRLAAFRAIRDKIRDRLSRFVEETG